MKILLKNANIISMNEKMPQIYMSDVYIVDNIISKIENNIEDEADKVFDLTGKYILPGFINAHNHLPMTLFRGFKQDKKLMEWLHTYIFPYESKLTAEIVNKFAQLACAEMIKSGITTTLDMYFFEQEIYKAIDKIGMRASIGISISDSTNFEDVETYILENNNKNERIKTLISPHSAYLCSEDTLKKCIQLAKKYNIDMQIHACETQDEINIVNEKYKMTPIELLEKIGAFDIHNILAHGIYLSNRDIDILKKHSIGIVHNPVSNAILASGICDVRKLLDNGINVCLGTDGAGSTACLNMFEEMRLCGYLQKINNMNPEVITAYEILKMATINGAKAINMENEIGSIEVGKKADIVIYDLDKLNVSPKNDVISSIVYSVDNSNIETVIIDGSILVQDGEIYNIDEKKLIEECNKIASEFLI